MHANPIPILLPSKFIVFIVVNVCIPEPKDKKYDQLLYKNVFFFKTSIYPYKNAT